ncbi:MAG: hypothetical protein ABEJ66_00135, partial [Candidatus Nanohaloarchaea archaeon]
MADPYFIELYGDNSGAQRNPEGDPDLAKLQKLKPYMRAAVHNTVDGVVLTTLWRIEPSAAQTDVDNMVAAAQNHINHGVKDAALRGLELRPGTPTPQEVNDLR